jgi:hypothetical protein
MPIAAGMVTVLHLATCRTGVNLPTQGLRAALLNGAHCLAMAVKDLISVFLAVGRAVLAENIGQF